MRRELLASIVFAVGLSPLLASARTAEPLPTGRDLTFAEAYNRILDRSLAIATQELQVDAAKERRLRAWGAFTPVVSADLSETRLGEPATGPTRSAGLALTLNLFKAGGDIAGVQSAKHDLVSNEQKLSNTRQTAEDDAISALISTISAVRRRVIQEKIVELREDSLKIARERYAKGLLPMQEVDKVSIDVENSRASLTDARNRESEVRATLKAALGTDAIATDWPWREAIAKGPRLEDTPFQLESRADWRSLTETSESERAKKRQALGSLLPTVDLVASYGNADLSDSSRRDWKSVLTLSVPLWNGFRDYSTYRLQDIAAQTSEYQLEALRRSAPAEVESLKANHRGTRESAIARESTARLTERIYADNLQRFRLGRASANDLEIDQERLLQSQLLEIDGWSSVHLSFSRLCHGLGGFVTGAGRCEGIEAR